MNKSLNLNSGLSERLARRTVSESIHAQFKSSSSKYKRAMRALRASRPGQAYRSHDSITYLDLFDYGGYHFANLEVDHQLALLSKVADFILADNVSHFGDWSGMLFVQSVVATSRFYSACNLLQRESLYQFISYMSIWRLERHECEIFKDYFESVLEKWKGGYYTSEE